MTRINDKVLFSALGCLAIIAKGKEGKKNAATQAEILAGYIDPTAIKSTQMLSHLCLTTAMMVVGAFTIK